MEIGLLGGLLFPLVGSVLLLLCAGRISRCWAGLVGCAAILLSGLCFLGLLLHFVGQGVDSHEVALFHWIAFQGFQADFLLHLDRLSLLMCLVVTGVGFLIHVYANGYMEHEPDYARFFTCMNFFVFAMLLLVLAGNLLLLFVGWEGVGLASYLLIGFWYQRASAAKAAIKAFVVNRVGDLGLLLGILLTFYLFGTSDIATIQTLAPQQFSTGASVITVLCLLYFVGAIGKSAQLPLHVWLADAMEGPTPVSALIHAATMVTAGVYLVVRLHPLFLLSPVAMQIVACVGALTALFAACCAVAQTDLKRVLAYSTVSQLGYMFLACGVGAFYTAVFHLTMHAFIKALLFLAAGNVVHMLHGVTQMGQMGGLKDKLRYTHLLFLIGVIALSGVPPLAAFFSKELILEMTAAQGPAILFYAGLITALLTAYYLTRAYSLTFRGPSHLELHPSSSLREAPLLMLIPVAVLATLSVGGGVMGFSWEHTPPLPAFLGQGWVSSLENELSTGFHLSLRSGGAILVSAGGVVLALIVYSRIQSRLGRPWAFLHQAFGIDALYHHLVVVPFQLLSLFVVHVVEPRFFAGMIRRCVWVTQATSSLMQKVQSGQVRSYVAWMTLGMGLLIAYFVF